MPVALYKRKLLIIKELVLTPWDVGVSTLIRNNPNENKGFVFWARPKKHDGTGRGLRAAGYRGCAFECKEMLKLRPFQRRFLAGALAPDIDTAALSIPRGNGKTALAAHILERGLTPGDSLHVPGAEYLLCAASIEQARLCYRFVRAALEPTGDYRFIDSATRIGITHVPSNTKLRVLSSNGKTAQGIVGCPLVVADEPGSWEINGGQLMADALLEAQGKPGSDLRIIFIGTLAPLATGPGHWWHDMIAGGSRGSTFVMALRGDPKKWDDWHEIKRCNPLVNLPGKDGAKLRKKLIERRDDARRDSRLKARFQSYRLNVPSGDESTVLLTVDDWERVCKRPDALPAGRPIVGIDLGANRAWSAAVACWRSGRVEALAIAPGIPDVGTQERRDMVPSGVYQKLADSRVLHVATGLRVVPPSDLINAILAKWGRPELVVCDRFRLPELQDCAGSIPLSPRVTRWSEASADIRGLRALAKDGPLSCPASSRHLITASLAVAMVKNDDQGSCRLVKRGSNNTARDDAAAAFVLAAGALHRALKKPSRRWRYRGPVV